MFHFLTVLTRSGEGIPSQRVSSTRRKVLFIPKSLENAERVSQMPGCRWAVGESAAIKGKNKIQTLHGKALIRRFLFTLLRKTRTLSFRHSICPVEHPHAAPLGWCPLQMWASLGPHGLYLRLAPLCFILFTELTLANSSVCWFASILLTCLRLCSSGILLYSSLFCYHSLALQLRWCWPHSVSLEWFILL